MKKLRLTIAGLMGLVLVAGIIQVALLRNERLVNASVVNWGVNREYFDRLCHSLFGMLSALAGGFLGRAIWVGSRCGNTETAE